jgi:ATP-dependent Clp protease ATP-binding subunit ClpA
LAATRKSAACNLLRAPKKPPRARRAPAGKTAIGGLAQRIVAGDAENLRDKVIMSLDIPASWQGQGAKFEERQAVISEVTDPTAISCLIDEMHTSSSQPGGEGAMGRRQPAQAPPWRGELHAIWGHHAWEYQKYIRQKDKALERRS